MGDEMRNAHKVLARKPKGKKPFGRYRHRWEDNIKVDLQEMGYDVVDWVQLAQDSVQHWSLVNTVMYLLVPLKVGNLLAS